MKTITLELSDSAADKLEGMSPTDRKAICETLDRIISNRRSLVEIMREAGEQAEKNGLTPEILEELLRDE